ncbi:MAG: Glycerol-3-phosphate acyltransferase [Eubacteriales bacterium SKADARSKE-1]|nr:Glycerol-3-phosphate acyltransferase [Eubacteriales bacterium SKADARSKE-1]
MNLLMNFMRNYWYYVILVIVSSYMLGSISFSIIITKLFKNKQDIRNYGSGNAGFTNVLRSIGPLPAILTMLGDFGKGALAILISEVVFSHCPLEGIPTFYIIRYGMYIAGFCCIIGHIYPCFFEFRGGKAVLTTFSMAVIIDWRIGLLALGVFIFVLAISKIVSLSSILAAASFPIWNFIMVFFVDYSDPHSTTLFSYVIISTLFSFLIALIIIYKHGSNIDRILSGTEKKLTFAKRKV